MDLPVLFNLVLVIGGLFLFILSIKIVKDILNLFPKAQMNKNWRMIEYLIIFFIFGYSINILAFLFGWVDLLEVMVSLVYFFGALFVFIVVNVSFRTYRILKQAAEEST